MPGPAAWFEIPALTIIVATGMVGRRIHIGQGSDNGMEKEKLQQLISRLHLELSSAESVDEKSRALLQKLTQDIQSLAAAPDSLADDRASATGQLEEVALKFETDHPKLSMALGELADALGKIGI